MKQVAAGFMIAGALALGAPSGHAVPITFTTQLSGPNESPPVESAGTGTATVVFDTDADTLGVQTAFSGLVGQTTVAHIHCCTADPLSGIAGVATQVPSFAGFPVGVTSGSYSRVFDLADQASWNPAFVTANGGTLESAESAFGAGLASGRAYLNIHTGFAPGGEIRGFLVQAAGVPEPGTLGLLGLAMLVFAAMGRKPWTRP